ncbi:MAG: RNA polymerase sigma factor [Myxococcota bacterium]
MQDLEHHYRRLFPIVRAKCLRLLGSEAEAEEVAQETFIRLWKAGQSTSPPRELLAWAHTAATRLSIDLLRKRRLRRTIPLDDTAIAHQSHLRLMLAELARGVPDDQLTAVLLHRVDGVPQDEIARSLGCTARTVRRWIQDFEAHHVEAS